MVAETGFREVSIGPGISRTANTQRPLRARADSRRYARTGQRGSLPTVSSQRRRAGARVDIDFPDLVLRGAIRSNVPLLDGGWGAGRTLPPIDGVPPGGGGPSLGSAVDGANSRCRHSDSRENVGAAGRGHGDVLRSKDRHGRNAAQLLVESALIAGIAAVKVSRWMGACRHGHGPKARRASAELRQDINAIHFRRRPIESGVSHCRREEPGRGGLRPSLSWARA